MAKNRRNFTGSEKLAILREHLIEKVPISQVCDKHGVQPTLFYAWQKKLFEEGVAVFDGPKGRPKRQEDTQALRIQALEAKLKQKNDVMIELLQEHMQLKKELGEL
jgi:transposase-like protein